MNLDIYNEFTFMLLWVTLCPEYHGRDTSTSVGAGLTSTKFNHKLKQINTKHRSILSWQAFYPTMHLSLIAVVARFVLVL